MLAMFTPASIEAQKVISMSIGKINASRVTRTGTSLHRSLLVATVLHKARNVYLEEERERASRYPQCPSSPELTVTPVCQMPSCNNNSVSEQTSDNQLMLTNNKVVDSLLCHEDQVYTPDHNSEDNRLPVAEANTDTSSDVTTIPTVPMPTITTNTTTTVSAITSITTTTTTSNSSHARKRRRVSDQETAAAISSILPKRLRSELRDDVSVPAKQLELRDDEEQQFNNINVDTDSTTPQVEQRLSVPQDDDCQPQNLSKSADADREEELAARLSPPPTDSKDQNDSTSSSDDSDSDDSDVSDTSVGEEMEVDQLTSLVSYFSFSQSQQKTDFSLQAAPHVVALTA